MDSLKENCGMRMPGFGFFADHSQEQDWRKYAFSGFFDGLKTIEIVEVSPKSLPDRIESLKEAIDKL